MTKLHILTKSRFVQSVRCKKLAWLAEHKPEIIKEDLSHVQEGQAVGALARTLYPTGILVEGDNLIQKTQLLMQARVTIFEATFQVNRLLCKVDILAPVDGGWELIEVKSATDVKSDHIEDVSFQAMLLREAGVQVIGAYVLHINSDFKKSDVINPELFFTKASINVKEIDTIVASTLAAIDGSEPTVALGSYCNTSQRRTECPAKSYCWKHLPENNVMHFYFDKKMGFNYLLDGVQGLLDVKPELLEGKHIIQYESLKNNAPHIQSKQIQKFLEHFAYPLYFFDLETIGPALPLHDGAKPYQAIPFQFSLHILGQSGELTHHEFLAQDDDPRPAFTHALELLGDSGTILAYNAGFEKGILKDLARWDPNLVPRIESLCSRFVDLIDPFKQFWYYDAKQKGSCSLKAVLPALTGISYDALTIKKGDVAASEYYRVTYDNPQAEDREFVREALLRYCELDTLAMVEIYRVLQAASRN